MKKTINNLWAVFYPIVMYYLVSALAFFGMTILFGEDNRIYMLKQMVSSGATIPFLMALRKQDMHTTEVVFGKAEKLMPAKMCRIAGLTVVAMMALGIALNNFIVMTPLVKVSTGFQNVNEAFFGGTWILEVLASCVVIPIAEELLFRGLVLSRCMYLVTEPWAILFSALLFGLIHVNVVQLIYATALGVFLAVIVRKTKHIRFAILGHAAANFIAVIRAETGILEFSYQATASGIAFSLGMVGVGILAMWLLIKLCNKEGSLL